MGLWNDDWQTDGTQQRQLTGVPASSYDLKTLLEGHMSTYPGRQNPETPGHAAQGPSAPHT